MSLLPSERTIRERLEARAKRSPGEFQKIAEDFLAKRDPGRYRGLRPQGRNADLQTTKGFPDAYAPIGRDLHLVEATTGSWRSHLEQSDSERLSKIANAASYVFFALESAEKLIPQKPSKHKAKAASAVAKDETYYKDLIAARGVPRDAIEFIFVDQLVRELRSPRYATILRDLGLAHRIPPFEHVDDVAECDPDAPRRADYRSGDVVDRRKCERLTTLIRQSRVPIVVGLGGVGKTTIGLAVAHRWMSECAAGAYYGDVKLSTAMGSNVTREILEALDMYDGTQELFVIDNVHLLGRENLSRLMDKAQSEDAPPMLLLARSFDSNLLQSRPIQAKARFAVDNLVVDEADLLSAYKFMQRRAMITGELQHPTAKRLAEWLRMAPDLVLFLAALKNQRRRIAAGLTPHVTEDDAIRYVQTHFVEVLAQEDRPLLIAIASLATLEIPASEACLGGVEPKWLIAHDLIAPTSVSASTKRYALPHDALGGLILRCFDDESIAAVWQDVLERDAFQATYIAHQLLDLGRKEEAKVVLTTISDRLWRFTQLVPPGYAFVLHNLYSRAGLRGPDLAQLKALYSAFIEENEAFLSGARSFFEFIKSVGGDVDEFMNLLLATPLERLRSAAQLAQPAELGQLMLASGSEGAGRIAARVRELLTEAAVQQAFVNHFFQLPLGSANRVLAMIRRCPAEVRSELEAAIRASKEGMHSLLEHVGAAMRTEKHGPRQSRYVIELLADSQHAPELARWLSGSTSKRVRYLLRGAASAGPHTRELISKVLATQDPVQLMPERPEEVSRLLAEVILAVTDEQILRRFINALPPEEPLTSLVLFWHPAQMIEALTRVEHLFPRSPSATDLRQAVLVVLRRRLGRAVADRKALAVVFLRHAWQSLGYSPLKPDDPSVAVVAAHDRELQHAQERYRSRQVSQRARFEADAIASAIADVLGKPAG